MKTSHLALLVLLAVAAAVVAETREDAPPQEGTGLEGSNCQRCHGSGSGLYLQSMFSVGAASTPIALNEPVELTVAIRNDWLAQLRDLSARLDLGGAPATGFSAQPPPILNVTSMGNLTFDPLNPLSLTVERTARVEMPLPAGATAFRIRLVPDNATGEAAPDLELRLWAPASDTKGDPTRILDGSGKGGAEILVVPEAEDGMRSGTWLAEVAQAACTETLDRSCLQAQGFRVVGDAWFNVSAGARSQTRPFALAELDGQDVDAPKTTEAAWTLFLREPPQGNEALRITVNATAHYEHHPNSARYDDWPYTAEIVLPVRMEGGLDAAAPPPPPVAAPSRFLTGVEWGETVGYLSGFALVASMASGGAFGQGSRRLLNRLFGQARRRIAFHNVLSYGVILFAVAHTVVFVAEALYHWSAGLLWGGLGVLGMLLLGVTGALQAPMVRWWGHSAWRWTHFSLGYLTALFTLVHMGLDGAHFTSIPERLDWHDPVLEYFRGAS